MFPSFVALDVEVGIYEVIRLDFFTAAENTTDFQGFSVRRPEQKSEGPSDDPPGPGATGEEVADSRPQGYVLDRVRPSLGRMAPESLSHAPGHFFSQRPGTLL